jgi:hypothetical protein
MALEAVIGQARDQCYQLEPSESLTPAVSHGPMASIRVGAPTQRSSRARMRAAPARRPARASWPMVAARLGLMAR